MSLGTIFAPKAVAIDCATATEAGQHQALSSYQIKHFHYGDGHGHIFLMTRGDQAVAELQYQMTPDELTLEVIDHSIDLKHSDPNLERELFEVLKKLKPHALVVFSLLE